MKTYLYSVLTLLFFLTAQIQSIAQPLWTASFGANNVDNITDLSVNSQNAILLTGTFHGEVDFDPGAGQLLLHSDSGSSFFGKYTIDGELIWARNLITGSGGIQGAFADDAGNIYTTGGFIDSADFDPGSEKTVLYDDSGSSFLAKYDTDGNLVWVKNFGAQDGLLIASNVNRGKTIAMDADSNLIVGGILEGSGDFDPSNNVVTLTSEGTRDIFVAKFDKTGNYLWAFNIGSSSSDELNDLFIGENQSVYITGFNIREIDLDPSADSAKVGDDASLTHKLLFAKYDKDGNFILGASVGEEIGARSEGRSIVSDANNNIYIAGIYDATVDFDPSAGIDTLQSQGLTDGFIVKYDQNGNLEWAESIGLGKVDDANDLVLDQNEENVYVTGVFSTSGAFINKYSLDGELNGALLFPGSNSTANHKIALADNYDIVFGGQYQDSLDLAAESTIEEWQESTIAINATKDIFLAKYNYHIELDLGNDTTLCSGDSLFLDASASTATGYLWNNGSDQPIDTASTEGTYTVEVSNIFCELIDSIRVQFDTPPLVELGEDTMLCFEQSLVLNAESPGATYLWQDGSTNSTLSVDQAGTYSVLVTVGTCDPVADDIDVTVSALRPFDLGDDTTVCAGDNILLTASSSGASAAYLWQDASTDSTFNANTAGEYFVRVSSAHCSYSDTIRINDFQVGDLGGDTTICMGTSLVFDVSTENATYFWSDSTTEESLSVSEAGTYTVQITSICGVKNDTVDLSLINCDLVIPNVFTPNDDQINDQFVISGLADQNSSLQIFNRWGQLMFETNLPAGEFWDGRTPSGQVAETGVYFYTLKVGEESHSGSVQLLR